MAGLAVAGLAATGAGAQTSTDPGVTDKDVTIGYISSETGVAGATHKNARQGVPGARRRPERQGRRQRSQDRPRDHRRQVVRRQPHRRPGPGAEPQACSRWSTTRPFAFLSYRYLKDQGVPMIGGGFDGTYYYDEGQREHHLRPRQRHPGPRSHLRHGHQRDEEARRHEGRPPSATARRRRRASRPRPPRPTAPTRRVSRACTSTTRSSSAAPTSDRSCSASRTPGADGAVPAARLQHQLRHRAGAPAERREDEGERPRHRATARTCSTSRSPRPSRPTT